jgi:hypothetical protein
VDLSFLRKEVGKNNKEKRKEERCFQNFLVISIVVVKYHALPA